MWYRPCQDCSHIGNIESTMTPHLKQGLVHSNHQRYDRHVSQGTGQVTEEVRPASTRGVAIVGIAMKKQCAQSM